MSDAERRNAILILGAIAGLALAGVVTLAIVGVPDPIIFTILSNVLSGSVGIIGGVITTRQQGPPPAH